MNTNLQKKNEKTLLENIDKQAISIYELENCVEPLEIESLSDEEKIKRKTACWTKQNVLSVYTFGHFSRLPYTSRNILKNLQQPKKYNKKVGEKQKWMYLF